MDDQNNPTIPAQDSYQPPMPSMTPPSEPIFTSATPMTETTTTTTSQPLPEPNQPMAGTMSFGTQAMTTTSTTTSVPLATAMPTPPADITPPVVPVVSEAQWPESKPKSKMPQVLGGIAAIILVVGVAIAAYFVSIRVSGQLAVAPTAPTSEPFAFNQKDIVKLGSAKAQKEYYDAPDAKARAATALGQYFAANPTAAGNRDAPGATVTVAPATTTTTTVPTPTKTVITLTVAQLAEAARWAGPAGTAAALQAAVAQTTLSQAVDTARLTGLANIYLNKAVADAQKEVNLMTYGEQGIQAETNLKKAQYALASFRASGQLEKSQNVLTQVAANTAAAKEAVDKLIAEGAAKGGTLIGTDKGQLVGCEAIYVDVCNKYDQRTVGGTVFMTAADAALYWLQVGQALDWTYGDPTHPTVKVPKGYYPCAGGNFCKIGATTTVTSGGGKGGGGTTTLTTTCTEQCPGTDGVLRSCTPPEADGSSADSLCAWAGRVETCGGQSFCCPAAGGTWTTTMTACTTVVALPVPGACTEVALFASTTTGYSSTPMTAAQKSALHIGDKIRIGISGSKADLKARFRVYINDVVEATGDTASPEWRLGQAYAGAGHLTTYYSDYEIKSSGNYEFEGQVSTKP